MNEINNDIGTNTINAIKFLGICPKIMQLISYLSSRFTAHGINNFQKTFFAFLFAFFTLVFTILALKNRKDALTMVQQDDISEKDTLDTTGQAPE